MKLAVDCRLIGTTGIGVFIDNVLENMVRDTNNTFILFGDSKKLEPYISLSNCSIVECNYKSFSLSELLRFPVDVVNECDAFYTPNFNIPIGIKVPIFSTIHDILFFETENFGSFIHRSALRWYVSRALRISQCVFTVSEFSRRRIKNYFHSTTNMCVVANGINRALHNYKQSDSEERRGIVFLGSIKRHKGLHVLLDAYYKLKAVSDVCPPLTIIGHVDFRTKDEKILDAINKNKENITFLGAVDNDALYDVLSRSEVLVSPSFYEGFGIPPLEAMYLGTPAIISDIPVYKEVYKSLPVTFFKTGDSEDLLKKLCNFKYQHLSLRDKIDEMYSYQNTAISIIKEIKKYIS